MTKDVLVHISGLHLETDADAGKENETIEVIVPGFYYFKAGKHYILYEEIDGKIMKEYRVNIELPDMVTRSKTKYFETVFFREDVGMFKKELINPNSTSYTKLEYEVVK